MIAEFRMWKPKVAPRAIIILAPPSQWDGRKDISDPGWRMFAKQHGCALVGCFFQDDFPTGIEEYADAKVSGQRLIDFLKLEMKSEVLPPLLMFGFSAGGQFNYQFAVNYPELVGAFVVNKGGIYYTALAPPATRNVPGLFIIGARDAEWRIAILNGIWAVNKVAGAEWGRVIEPCAHALWESEEIGREFFTDILKRIP